MQQTSENIKKNDLLEELLSNLEKDAILNIVNKDTTIHVLERNRLKRVIEGFINKDKRYANLSDDNADYFFETLYPLYESSINFIKTSDEFAAVVKGIGGKVDVAKINDRMIHAFNENYRGFTKNYPLFNYGDAATFGIHEGTPYNEFVHMLHGIYNENVDLEPFSFDSYRKNLDERLSANDVMKKLDDLFKDEGWTTMAWQWFFNSFKKYDDSMRDEIVDFVTKNPSNPKVKTVLGEGFKEGIKEDMTEDEQKKYLESVENVINNGTEISGGDSEEEEENNTSEGSNDMIDIEVGYKNNKIVSIWKKGFGGRGYDKVTPVKVSKKQWDKGEITIETVGDLIKENIDEEPDNLKGKEKIDKSIKNMNEGNGLKGGEYDWEQFVEQMNSGEDVKNDRTRKKTYVDKNIWADIIKNQDKYKKAYPKVIVEDFLQ